MLLILIIILLVLALGGGYGVHSGFYVANPFYGYGTGLLGTILIVVLVLVLLGRL